MGQLEERYISLLTDFGFKKTCPDTLKEKIFNRLFQEAEIARFNPQELHEYEDSLKAYRDIKNSIDTALEQGMERGLAQGREEGRAEGIAEGRAEGIAKGREEGRAEGIVKGREEGRAEGIVKGREEGRAEGIVKGRAEGIAEEKKNTARKLLSLNTPVDIVAQVTGLTKEDIENLKP